MLHQLVGALENGIDEVPIRLSHSSRIDPGPARVPPGKRRQALVMAGDASHSGYRRTAFARRSRLRVTERSMASGVGVTSRTCGEAVGGRAPPSSLSIEASPCRNAA